jgi:uncharacterized membrane protein
MTEPIVVPAAPPSATPGITTQRIEAFSDGVFAIAATLLVLDLLAIPVRHGHLAHDLGRAWPTFATFVVSFFTIGIVWVNHHALFARIARADRALLFLNLLLLMWVVAIPFPTALLAEFLRGSDKHVAAVAYAGTFLAMALSFFAIVQHVARRPGLLAPTLTPDAIRRFVGRNVAGVPVYVVALALGFVSAPACLGLCGAVALYYVFDPTAGDAAVDV